MGTRGDRGADGAHHRQPIGVRERPPWGQAFIQAYVVDKRLGSEDLAAERLDVGLGSFLTNLIAAFIVVACAATLWTAGKTNIPDAATAAQALGPLAGPAATVLFAVGLLAASLLGLGVVPLASAYTACEGIRKGDLGACAGMRNRRSGRPGVDPRRSITTASTGP